MPQEKSAGAIIFRREQGVPHYLLLRYPSKHWEFTKGHIEKGERVQETIRREVREETGISDLRFAEGFKEYSKYFFRKNYGLTGKAREKAPWVFKLVVFLLAETRTERVKISFEHTGFAWLPFEQAVRRVTYKNAKELLTKAHEFVSRQGASGG